MKHGTGIEMAEIIPGFARRFDIEDLVRCIVPRNILVVSATEDKFAQDADEIVDKVRAAYPDASVANRIEHKRYRGGHAITRERFEFIVDWIQRRSEQTTL